MAPMVKGNALEWLASWIFNEWPEAVEIGTQPMLRPILICINLLDGEPYTPGHNQGDRGSNYKISQTSAALIELLDVHTKNRRRQI